MDVNNSSDVLEGIFLLEKTIKIQNALLDGFVQWVWLKRNVVAGDLVLVERNDVQSYLQRARMDLDLHSNQADCIQLISHLKTKTN